MAWICCMLILLALVWRVFVADLDELQEGMSFTMLGLPKLSTSPVHHRSRCMQLWIYENWIGGGCSCGDGWAEVPLLVLFNALMIYSINNKNCFSQICLMELYLWPCGIILFFGLWIINLSRDLRREKECQDQLTSTNRTIALKLTTTIS